MSLSLAVRYAGCLAGLAVGDAVGTTVEFQSRGSFPPVTDMAGGGPFGLTPGQWTDDTSMALCLAESLLLKKGFDARDQMDRYLKWWTKGYLSSTGECFDIGNTVRDALGRYERSGDPYSGSPDPHTAGNGSIMRLAPVALFYHPDVEEVVRFCGESSRTTHGAPEAVECCELLGLVLSRCLSGLSKEKLLDVADSTLKEPKVRGLATGRYQGKGRGEIRGTGYSVESLEAALWCFSTTSTFQAAVLEAANLGDDADTTAAIVGQIAGAFYGVESIPAHWMKRLFLRNQILALAAELYAAASA